MQMTHIVIKAVCVGLPLAWELPLAMTWLNLCRTEAERDERDKVFARLAGGLVGHALVMALL